MSARTLVPAVDRPARLLLPLGLGLACVLHLSVTGQVVVPVLAGLLGLAGAVLGPRWSLPQAAQALLVVGAAMVALVALLVDAPITPRAGGPQPQYVLFSATALLSVGPRLALQNPERGHGATWIFLLLAFVSCGRVAHELYLPLVLATLALSWLHVAWGTRPSLRQILLSLGVLALGATVAASSAWGLQRAFTVVQAAIMERAVGGEVGFGAGAFSLGSMDGLRDNDEVVLRVHGPTDPHLRGQAYAEYGKGTWFPPGQDPEPAPPGRELSGELTTIEFVKEEQRRLFLPPEAGAVEVDPPGLVVDRLGIPRPDEGEPREVRFDRGPPQFTTPEPSEADLEVPPEVAEVIGPLVAAWTAGTASPTERLAAILARIEADYTYSLEYERTEDADPVVQFLTTSRLGHCEYFASGLVLAARQAGLPARVVTGFRSTERSPLGGHLIVRARDAHAWAEVWVDDAWVMVDPSPANAVNASFIQGAADDLRLYGERYGLQVLVVVLVLVFVGLQVRTLLRGRRAAGPAVEEVWIEGPPEWLLGLLEVLARDELQRAPAESIEAFAARTEAAGRGAEAGVLRRYAALRYGGIGEAGELAREAADLVDRGA